jgi:hypothetical protein
MTNDSIQPEVDCRDYRPIGEGRNKMLETYFSKTNIYRDFQMLLRFVVIFLLSTICTTAMGFTSHTESQIEDVALHDGRRIKVERTVQWKTEFHILDPFFGLPIRPRFETSGPDTFSIKFKHPDTQKMITWQGVQYYTPVLLDIVSGVPYLVVNGFPSKETESIYGCPELPYIYLKYESGFFGKWVPIPVEKAPEVLRESNLSQASRNDGGFFQRVIPRTYEEWNYMYKNNHRNERKFGDCRPPLQPLPDVPLPKPVDIELETVESYDYTVTTADAHYRALSERKGTIVRANCSKLFAPPNPENLMLGERFVNDMTGSIRLPYSGPAPLPPVRMLEKRTERYCNDKFVWFFAGHEEARNTIITKYTSSGEFLYSIRMVNPKTADNKLFRGMVLDSITAENGYLYFYWVQSLAVPTNSAMTYSHRMTKFRFPEPFQESASK